MRFATLFFFTIAASAQAPNPCARGNGMLYLSASAPVMSDPIKIQPLWYRDWPAGSKELAKDLLRNFGSISAWQKVQKLCDDRGNHVSGSITLNPIDVQVNGPESLSDAEIRATLTLQFDQGMPPDADTIYLIVAPMDTKLLTACSYHSWLFYHTVFIKYAAVSPLCAPTYDYPYPTPNDDLTVDRLATTIAHELAETASDPLLNAWYGCVGARHAENCGEIADVCLGRFSIVGRAWQNDQPFTQYERTGTGWRVWYIQDLWDNEWSKCSN